MSQWMVFLLISAVLLIACEAGHRFSRRLTQANDEPLKAQIDSIQSAVLALLGLLLAFTFSMAVNRFDNRRQLVLEEANSIGTTYLRASFLPEKNRDAVEELLRSYVDERLNFYLVGADMEKLAAVENRVAVLQKELWAHAVSVAKGTPNRAITMFIETLNQTIDLDASRLAALHANIPITVWLLLMVVSVVGCYASGYRAGASGVRTGFSSLLLPLLIAVIITFIADLDRSRHGFIGSNQQPLINLQKSIQAPPVK